MFSVLNMIPIRNTCNIRTSMLKNASSKLQYLFYPFQCNGHSFAGFKLHCNSELHSNVIQDFFYTFTLTARNEIEGKAFSRLQEYEIVIRCANDFTAKICLIRLF